MIAYRIHSHTESLDTVLDARRCDGWVADDEAYETQPHGVSSCATLHDMAHYVRAYSMGVKDTDTLVELTGEPSCDSDRDDYAVRTVVSSYRVLATGADFRAAATLYLDERGIEDWEDEDWDEAVDLHDVTPAIRDLVEGMIASRP